MIEKEFYLGDILGINTGSTASPQHTLGLKNLLIFMTGRELSSDEQFTEAIKECKPHLAKQFPQLVNDEITVEILLKFEDVVGKMTTAGSDKEEIEKFVAGWLAEQVAEYGERFMVKPIQT